MVRLLDPRTVCCWGLSMLVILNSLVNGEPFSEEGDEVASSRSRSCSPYRPSGVLLTYHGISASMGRDSHRPRRCHRSRRSAAAARRWNSVGARGSRADAVLHAGGRQPHTWRGVADSLLRGVPVRGRGGS
jgi:hypothetical protein